MSKGVPIIIDRVESFDRLSIYEVKYNTAQISMIFKSSEIKNRISENIRDLENRIVKAVGYKLYHKVKLSHEYNDLYESNRAIFDGVNQARKKEISDFELNRLNEIRSEKKRNLNAKFFGNKLKEIKIDGDGNKIS